MLSVPGEKAVSAYEPDHTRPKASSSRATDKGVSTQDAGVTEGECESVFSGMGKQVERPRTNGRRPQAAHSKMRPLHPVCTLPALAHAVCCFRCVSFFCPGAVRLCGHAQRRAGAGSH